MNSSSARYAVNRITFRFFRRALGTGMESFQVSVIFHVAATVKFNERLDVATAVNAKSVKHIVDLAKACKNLKVWASYRSDDEYVSLFHSSIQISDVTGRGLRIHCVQSLCPKYD